MTIHARNQQREEHHEFRTHSSDLVTKSRRLRKEMTDVERRLWSKLSRDQTRHRLRRQHPIDRYIVDFICMKQKLIIELDGGQHNEQTAPYDAMRTATLEKLGYRILRFWNNEVLENLERVYDTIITELHKKP